MATISQTPATDRDELAQPALVNRLLVGSTAVLAALSLLKFVVLKPVVFLLIAVVYAAAIAIHRSRPRATAVLIAVLNTLTLAVIATRLGETFDTATDALVVLVGIPAALIGIASAGIVLRRSP
jgi:hypothetical protein